MADETSTEPEIRDELAAPAQDPEQRRRFSVGAFARRRRWWLGAGSLLGFVALAATVVLLRRKHVDEKTSPNAWKGRVAASLSGGQGGVLVLDPAGGAPHVLAPGEAIPKGAHLRTDPKTWARLRFDDGSTLVADRGGDVALDAENDRAATLATGMYVLEVTPQKDSPARVKLPGATITTDDGKLAISIDVVDGVTHAALVVARGAAVITTDGGQTLTALAGESAALHDGALSLQPAGDVGQAFLLAERDELELAPEGDSASVAGVGEIRARPPGSTGAGDVTLALTSQRVHVHIEGAVARTEIEETFASDTDQELEGIFRFPLPPDAQLERLAL
ncbi:MAG: VIT domain-containing protein, partial [Polyangiales bacterium]